jgi:hypothetical protein
MEGVVMTGTHLVDVDLEARAAVSRLRVVPVLGAAGFGVAAAVGALLAPDSYSSTRDTISVLAAADNRFGPVMMVGFLSLAVGLLVCAWRLWKVVDGFTGRLAAGMVAVAGGATAVAGLNRIACNPALAGCKARLDAHAPTATVVHGRAALFVFAPLLIAGFALGRACWRHGDRPLALLCLVVTGVDVALVVLTENAGLSVAGLLQRVFLTLVVGVPLLVQWRGPGAALDHSAGRADQVSRLAGGRSESPGATTQLRSALHTAEVESPLPRLTGYPVDRRFTRRPRRTSAGATSARRRADEGAS